MKTVLRILLWLAMLIASGLAVMLLLPFAKEGSSFEDWPVFAGAIALLLVLGFVWWLAVGRSLPKALIGWIVLLPPLVGHGGTLAALVLARFEGERLAGTIRIDTYRETPIVWPGFDGPVGIEVALELRHPESVDALILPPEIRMGPELNIPHDRLTASLTNGSGYFKSYYLDEPVGDLTLLKPVLFQKVFENPAAGDPNYRWTASAPFSSDGTTRLVYDLLPGTVDYLPDRTRICLASHSHGIELCAEDRKPETGCASPNRLRVTEPIYTNGQDLSALWVAAGAYDMTVDLSKQLTAALRQSSTLQSDAAGWQAMQQRLEPQGLVRAGYELCPAGKDSHTSFRVCYCRDG